MGETTTVSGPGRATTETPGAPWTTVVATSGAVLGTAALVALSLPAAFLLWTGVAVAVGRGDPTWNDGEEYWGTGFGLALTVLLALAQWLLVGHVRRRTGRRTGAVLAAVCVLPVVAVHVAAAATFLVD